MTEIKMFEMKFTDDFLEQLREKGKILFKTKFGSYFSGIVDWRQGRGQNYFIISDGGNTYDIIDIVEYSVIYDMENEND